MRYEVNDVTIKLIEDETLVAGEVKVHYAEFTFDSSWDEYTKLAVFKRGVLTMEQMLTDNKCIIPWEVLQKRGTLMVGVYGTTAEKTRPTLWAPDKIINDGAEPGKATREPTPSVIRQMLGLIEAAKEAIPKAVEEQVGQHNDDAKAHPKLADDIVEKALQNTIGRYITVTPDKWSDDTDLLTGKERTQRIAYKASNNNATTAIIDDNYGAPTDAILTEEWQSYEVPFVYAPTNYTGTLRLIFYGGKNSAYCHPYDIADVKLWLASDAQRTNLFPEDIAKLDWWWDQPSESCLALNRFSVAFDEDGHKYIHVWRQHPFISPSGTATNGNLAQLRAATGVQLTVGETYVLSVRMRTACSQHTAIAECEGIRDHSATAVSPVPTSAATYLDCGVRAFGQRIGELMLKADTVPSTDITIGVQASRGQGTGVIINTVMPEISGASSGGGGGMELLWENTNISEAFNSRTVTLSNQNYSKVLIVLATYYYYDWGEYFMSTLTVDGGALRAMPTSNSDGGSVSSSFIADMQFMDYAQNTVGASRRMSCVIDTSSGNIKSLYFDNGFSGPAGYLGYDDGAMMPVRIYGIA